MTLLHVLELRWVLSLLEITLWLLGALLAALWAGRVMALSGRNDDVEECFDPNCPFHANRSHCSN